MMASESKILTSPATPTLGVVIAHAPRPSRCGFHEHAIRAAQACATAHGVQRQHRCFKWRCRLVSVMISCRSTTNHPSTTAGPTSYHILRRGHAELNARVCKRGLCGCTSPICAWGQFRRRSHPGDIVRTPRGSSLKRPVPIFPVSV